jgi:RHS repeat-associated protein
MKINLMIKCIILCASAVISINSGAQSDLNHSQQAQNYRIQLIKQQSKAEINLQQHYPQDAPIRQLLTYKSQQLQDLINQYAVLTDAKQAQILQKQIQQQLNGTNWNSTSIKTVVAKPQAKSLNQVTGAPTNADLQPSIDANSQHLSIISLADSLDNNAIKIFNHIRENIKYTPTTGSIQGALGALKTQTANATDSASLMIATMRAAGIPARYVQGEIQISIARLKKWLGAQDSDNNDIQQLLSLLNQSGITYSTINTGGGISDIRFGHRWCEIWVNMYPSMGSKDINPKTWVALDASYKLNDYIPGINLQQSLANLSANFSNQINTAINHDAQTGSTQLLDRSLIDDISNSAGNQIQQHLNNTQLITPTLAQIFGHTQHIALDNRLLPASLPYKVITSSKSSQLANSDRAQLTLNIYANSEDQSNNNPLLQLQQPMVTLAAQNLYISAKPASSSDLQRFNQLFANVTDINSQLNEISTAGINVIIELASDEAIISQSNPIPLATRLLGQLNYSGQSLQYQHRFTLSAGENRVLSWNLQGGMAQNINAIQTTLSNLSPQTDAQLSNKLLLIANHSQLAATEIYDSWLAAINGINHYRAPSFIFSYNWLEPQTFLGVPTAVKLKGIANTGIKHQYQAYRNGQSQGIAHFNYQNNRLSALLSSQLLAQVYNGEQINASKLLADALNSNQDILQIDHSNAQVLDNNSDALIQQLRASLMDRINQGYQLSLNAQTQISPDYQGLGILTESSDLKAQHNEATGINTDNTTNSHTGSIISAYGAAMLQHSLSDTRINDWNTIIANNSGLITGIASLIDEPLNTGISTSLLKFITPTAVTSILADAQQAIINSDYWLLAIADAININSLIDPIPPVINLSVQPQQIQLGATSIITVSATDNQSLLELNVSIDGQTITLDNNNQFVFTPTRGGQFNILAIATDSAGNTSSQSQILLVIDSNDNQPPEVDIISPEDGSINTGQIDIKIRVQDPNIAEWRLSYRQAKDNSPRTLLAQGTTPINDATVSHWDTSSLRNGIYILILEAIDSNNQAASTASSIFLEGDLKIGHFQIAFEDLNIPVAGIPVAISRSYDSRDRNSDRAFGKGWEISYQSLQLSENRIPGLGWFQQQEFYNIGPVILPRYCIQPIGEKLISIRMPDGQLEKFKVQARTLNPTSEERPNCQDLVPPDLFTIQFTPQGDTNSSLSSSDIGGGLRVTNGNLQTLTGNAPIDPNKYQLTLQDGTIYSIDQGFDLIGIETTDGNSIKFTFNGIEHNNGYAVQFIRDSQDRIRFIQKPNGERIEYSYDTNGNLQSHTDLNGNTTSFTYIADHYLQDINDPRGIMVARNEYDADGRLIAHIDAQGNRIEYSHDIQGRTETIRDRNGNASIFVYDNAGSVIAETNAEGETTFHEYNDIRLETKRIDPLGHETIWTYDNFGNQKTETDHLGHITTSSYNERGEILTQTDDAGNLVIKNDYNDPNNPLLDGNLRKVTDALGNFSQFHWIAGHDDNNNVVIVNTGFTDTNGNRYQVAPISSGINNGLSGSTADLNGLKTETSYDEEAKPHIESQIITDNNGDEIARYTTTFDYNANGDLIKTTDTQNHFTETEYNKLNKVSATIDADRNRTTYEFDERGNPSKTIYPDASFETSEYDAEGNAITTTDRAGRVTKTIYDKANRVKQVILPDDTPLDDSDNPRTINDYDAAGRLIAVTDALGNTIHYEYNEINQRIKTTDAKLNVTEFKYNNLGRRIQTTDALGRITKFEYNELGNLIKTIFPDDTPNDDSDNLYTETTYDKLSRKKSQRDLAGNITSYEYTDAGNLSAVIDAMNHRTEYEYDQRGNKILQRDANGHETKWSYDELSRVKTRSLPEGQQESFTYDSRGNLKTKTDFNNETTIYDYNELNQLILTTYSDITTAAYTYTITGQIKTLTDARGITSYQYDKQNRLTRLDYPDVNFIKYQYDKNGNRTQLQTASQTVDYTYDKLNRLKTVTDINGTTIYTYDRVGNRAIQTNANGTTVTYSYDLLNRLEDLVHISASNTTIASYHYTLGANGNRQSISEVTGRIVDYTYDEIYRLKTETISDPINGNHFNQWSYDDVSNRLQQVKDGITTTYTYNNNDQLLSETIDTEIIEYAYDDNGNTLTKSINGSLDTSYTYNKENRMVQAITPISTIINTYDAGGIRQAQTVDGVTTFYLVDQNRAYAQVLEEQNDLFIPQITYVYGDDLISQTQGGIAHTFGYDGLGSTRILTDTSGVVQNNYAYQAFGEIDYQLGTVPNNYLFTGEQYDNNVGFYYLRARFYNPSNGRFTQMDTFQGMVYEPKSLHKYLYTHSDPINNIDPSGNITLQGLLTGLRVAGKLLVYGQSVSFVLNSYTDEFPTHFYETDPIQICSSSNLRCTLENVYDMILRYPATAHWNPELDQPVYNGEIRYVGWAIFPGGWVQFFKDDSAFKLTNETTKFHTLYNGTIKRWAEVGFGGITIRTIGEGDNFTSLFAYLNEKVGKLAFEGLDRTMRNNFR